MRTSRRQAIVQATAVAALAALAGLPSVWAQTPGTRTVRFILPNATGSGVDAITRGAQEALAKALGHPVVVENQAGAGGIVGLQALKATPPDGFTLSIVSNNVVIFPSVMKSVPFDMPGDFTPIAVLGATPIVIVANPKNVSASSPREFAALLKSQPGKLNYGSGGIGTILHLAGEMFVDELGGKATHVPYKGVGPMVADLLGGQIDFAAVALPSVQQHLRTGALKAIGVGTAQRVAAVPEVATVAEQGFPGYVVEAWFAVIGPKGMAAADVKRVHDAVSSAFADPAARELMARQGNTINVSSTEAAQRHFRSELEKYARLVKKAGIEAQ
jgi:tripartite-type tricarboxylate transporter receptor subunit TctC